jgi:methyl-accepting chemotaxis protein
MHIWRRLSIRNKLVSSMTINLLMFVGISSVLSIWLVGSTVRKRIVQDELPTVVNRIRADVQLQLAGPITASRAMVVNAFLQQWEADGETEAGTLLWKRLAANMKAEQRAASVVTRYRRPELRWWIQLIQQRHCEKNWYNRCSTRSSTSSGLPVKPVQV